MSYLAGRLAPARLAFAESRPLVIYSLRQAWCDQAVKVFLFFSWHLLGVDGRELALSHENGLDGHTVCELEYEGGWHLYDVSPEHQAVYRRGNKILSYEELRKDPTPVLEEDHPWVPSSPGIGKVGFYTTAGATIGPRVSEQILYNLPWPVPWNCP